MKVFSPIFLLLLFVVICTVPGETATTAYVEQWNISIGVLLTYISPEEGENLNPFLGASLHLPISNRIAFGADYYHRQEHIHHIQVFTQYQFSEPLWDDTWTSLQLGVSQIDALDQGEKYRGVLLGLLFSREFQPNWQAHTSAQINIFPRRFYPVLETGFQYFWGDYVSLELTYKWYDLRRYHGLNAGINVHF